MAATARQCQMNQKAKGGVFSFTFPTRSSSGVRNEALDEPRFRRSVLLRNRARAGDASERPC